MVELILHGLGLFCVYGFVVSLMPHEGERQGFRAEGGPNWFIGFWAAIYVLMLFFLFEDII